MDQLEPAQREAAGVQFDAFAAHTRGSTLPTWVIWGGNVFHQTAWSLQFSPYTPVGLLQDVTVELAEGQGTRHVPATTRSEARLSAQPPAPAQPPHLPPTQPNRKR